MPVHENIPLHRKNQSPLIRLRHLLPPAEKRGGEKDARLTLCLRFHFDDPSAGAGDEGGAFVECGGHDFLPCLNQKPETRNQKLRSARFFWFLVSGFLFLVLFLVSGFKRTASPAL